MPYQRRIQIQTRILQFKTAQHQGYPDQTAQLQIAILAHSRIVIPPEAGSAPQPQTTHRHVTDAVGRPVPAHWPGGSSGAAAALMSCDCVCFINIFPTVILDQRQTYNNSHNYQSITSHLTPTATHETTALLCCATLEGSVVSTAVYQIQHLRGAAHELLPHRHPLHLQRMTETRPGMRFGLQTMMVAI